MTMIKGQKCERPLLFFLTIDRHEEDVDQILIFFSLFIPSSFSALHLIFWCLLCKSLLMRSKSVFNGKKLEASSL